MNYLRCLVLFFLWPLLVYSEELVTNQELYRLYNEDQSDRKGGLISSDRDNKRLKAVQRIINSEELKTAEDFYYAALIFQHGSKPEHFKKSRELALTSAKLKPEFRRAKWLSCAVEDRYLHSLGKPQVWGTQRLGFSFFTLEPFDETAKTDKQRAACGIPPLKIIKERLREMNAKKIPNKPLKRD